MGDYYGGGYYSLAPYSLPRGPHRWLKIIRDRATLRGWPFVPPHPTLANYRPAFDGSLRRYSFGLSSRVLELGCGEGRELREMANAGFTDLTGADPFMRSPTEEAGLRLLKCEAQALSGRFDVIFMHHALEHVPDPRATLATLRSLAAEDALAVIRIPLAESWAHRKFGVEWAQFDPPRHFTLFSRAGFEAAAEATGWRIIQIRFDSLAFQVTGSILRQRGINVHADWGVISRAFSRQELRRYTALARRLNRAEDGDQAAFILVPA